MSLAISRVRCADQGQLVGQFFTDTYTIRHADTISDKRARTQLHGWRNDNFEALMIGFSGDGGEGRPPIKVELPLVRGLEVVRWTVAAPASGVKLLWICLLAGFYHYFFSDNSSLL